MKDWLEVSQWEAYQSTFILPNEVLDHVAKMVQWPDVQVKLVCGADLLVRMRGYLTKMLKYGIICVDRPDTHLEDFLRYSEEIEKCPNKVKK